MRAIVYLIPLALTLGCASTNHLKSEIGSRMPASTEDANWLARVCRSTTDNSTKSVQYVQTVSTTATPEQLQTLNSKLLFVKPQPQVNENTPQACTCDAVAVQSESKIYVNRSLFDVMSENDHRKLLNDMAVGVGVPASQIKSWCETKLKVSDN